MMGHTHMLAGAAGWLVTDAVLRMPPAAAVLGTGAAALAALFPDIDAPRSEITRSMGCLTAGLSWVVRRSCGGHRQITHSLLGTGLWSAAWLTAMLLAGWPLWLLFAIVQGYASHIGMDMLTRSGCPLLWPKQATWHWLPPPLRVTTGGKRRGKGRKRRRTGAEYLLVQPACLAVAVVAGVLVVQGR